MNLRNFCVVLALLACAGAAQAAYSISIREVGPDVVMTGSGSIDLTGMTPSGTTACTTPPSSIVPNGLCVGDVTGVSFNFYAGALGSSVAGIATVATTADSASGAPVMLALRTLYVPTGYASNTPISGTATFNGKTLASMGLTAGTSRAFVLPSGDSIGISVTVASAPTAPASIPTISGWGVIILSSALALFGLARIRRRR